MRLISHIRSHRFMIFFRATAALACFSLDRLNIPTISKANNSIILGNNFMPNHQSWLSILSRQPYLNKKISSLIYQSNETWYCSLNGARPTALAGSRLERCRHNAARSALVTLCYGAISRTHTCASCFQCTMSSTGKGCAVFRLGEKLSPMAYLLAAKTQA
jgi:hypothetical protein